MNRLSRRILLYVLLMQLVLLAELPIVASFSATLPPSNPKFATPHPDDRNKKDGGKQFSQNDKNNNNHNIKIVNGDIFHFNNHSVNGDSSLSSTHMPTTSIPILSTASNGTITNLMSSTKSSKITTTNRHDTTKKFDKYNGEKKYNDSTHHTSSLFNDSPSEESELSNKKKNKSTNKSIAILLNLNARSVTNELIELAQNVLGKDTVYVTRTLEDARQVAHSIRDCKLVIPVGGDGTLSTTIQLLCNAIRENDPSLDIQGAMKKLPHIGYIPMGTGNAIGSVVGNIHTNIPNRNQQKQKPQRKRQKLKKLLQRFVTPKRYHFSQIQKYLEFFASVAQDLQESSGTTNLDTQLLLDIDTVELPMMTVTTNDGDNNNNNNNDIESNRNGNEKDANLCFFAGMGFDSLMLQDFQVIKAWSKKRKILPSYLGSVFGYCVALITRTLPQCITKQAHEIQVQISTCIPTNNSNNNNGSSSCFRDNVPLWIDHRRGDVIQPVIQEPTHAANINNINNNVINSSNNNNMSQSVDNQRLVLYDGPAGIVAAGTSPFYGGHLKLFPFARLAPNKMHLRIGRIHPMVGFINIPGIFKGSYRDAGDDSFGCLDFLGSNFDISIISTALSSPSTKVDDNDNNDNNNYYSDYPTDVQEGYPLQHSGESVGFAKHVRLQIVPEPVKFVTPFPKRPVFFPRK